MFIPFLVQHFKGKGTKTTSCFFPFLFQLSHVSHVAIPPWFYTRRIKNKWSLTKIFVFS